MDKGLDLIQTFDEFSVFHVRPVVAVLRQQMQANESQNSRAPVDFEVGCGGVNPIVLLRSAKRLIEVTCMGVS